MKNVRPLVGFIGIVIGCISITAITLNSLPAPPSSMLKLKLTTPKGDYVLGEVVQVTVTIQNTSATKISLPEDVFTTLEIQISNDGINYSNYYGKGRGLQIEVAREIEIAPSGTIEQNYTILWNSKPQVAHLNSDVAERLSKGRILTDFAFSEPGKYFVRVAIPFSNQNGRLILSEPIMISIKAPQGDDLEVWNKIKDKADVAHFLQEGDFLTPSYKREERTKLIEEIEELINTYPASFYSHLLLNSLERFRVNNLEEQVQICKFNPSLEQCKH